MNLRLVVYAAAAWTVGLPSVASSQVTIDTLMKQCGKETTVFGFDESSKPVPVGKAIDGFCSGFLEGAFATLLRSGAICLEEKEEPTPEFLLSVVQTYRADGGAAEKDAALLIETAFKRAFRCKP